MSRLRSWVDLVFGPDEYTPVSVLWGLLLAAVGFAAVAWLLSDDDAPNDLGDE